MKTSPTRTIAALVTSITMAISIAALGNTCATPQNYGRILDGTCIGPTNGPWTGCNPDTKAPGSCNINNVSIKKCFTMSDTWHQSIYNTSDCTATHNTCHLVGYVYPDPVTITAYQSSESCVSSDSP